MNEDTMDESTVIENKQNENEISSPIEPSDTKIEEQNLPDPEIEENVVQQEGRENIPAIAALLLQNTGNMSKLKEIKEFSNKNNSDKNENRIETCQKTVLSEALTNGSPLPDSELENSNSCQEKILMNSKDSSMLSTTDTQDEIETIDNGDQTFTNHLNEQAVIAALCKRAKQELLESSDSEDSVEEMLGSDLDSQSEETFSVVSGSEYDEGSQGSIQDEHFETPVPMDNGNVNRKLLDFKINKQENNDCMADDQKKIPTDNENPNFLHLEIKKEENNDCITDDENEPRTDNGNENPKLLDIEIKNEENNDCITDNENDLPTDNGNEKPKLLDIEIKKDENNECVNENKTAENKNNGNTVKAELRRSSRTVKVRKYSYDEQHDYADSETDESDSEDTPKRKSRPIMIKDTKSLVEIAARQAARSTAFDRREPQLVLIGSKPKQAPSVPIAKNISSSINTSLYQSIVARGTSVTPVSSRPAPNTTSQAVQTSPTPTPVILPSLTDDMFVVEAPSFIVPYVYEKPSIEPFKDVVKKLGKNIQEQRAKAGKELLQKKMEEKYKQQKERQERIDQGEEETDSEEEASQEVEENMSKIAAEKRQHGLEEDESSCDGSVSSDTDDNSTTVLEGIKNTESVPASPSTSNSYFDCSLGKFFTNIGMGLVEEYVQCDLLKTQQRKLQREKKSGYSTKQRELENSIKVLTKNYEMSKDNNKSLKCLQLKCEHCTFKTESEIVLAQHMETPHMKNNMYKCNFCEFEIRSPHDILFHMEAEHNVRGRLERAPAYHQCVNCAFEDNGKGKLARHVIACAKKFKPELNLSPPVDWEPPAKIPKIAKGRQTMLGAPIPMTGPFGRPQAPMNSFGRPHPSMNSFGRSPIPSLLPSTSTPNRKPRARITGPFTPCPVVAGGSIVRGSSIQQQTAAAQAAAIAKKNHPSISITPVPARSVLPRPIPPRPLPPRPVLPVPPHESATATFVICEICDGYIKDLEQLRNHMQWIHKVKIHPKMIYNRPPLNCQKCQFRFFTDLGLERHLLGSHGLVTSSMQDAANKNKDSGRCPLCGKVFQWKLLNHMAKDHAMTLKPAHLSYKCTVCCATFEMYKQFESHVYSAHSVVANRVMDKVPVPVPVQTRSSIIPKGLKINTEITITAQPARPAKNK